MSSSASAQPASRPPGVPSKVLTQERIIKISIKFDGQTIIADLKDNPSSRDLVAQLPLTLNFEDYHATEKIAYPPRKLATQDAPAGFDPSVGTVAYYAPWGNLALFYKDFGYSKSLVNLGNIVSGMDALLKATSFNATIERVID
ncbi:cyclophilin-like fold protein [Caballeronia glathei]|uniref:cyclophilin-like fold protein n=1 Tax=Caballeronia glathei TaxID=60547 RepID=UPI001EED8A21|nr:cyclophilin-like fold protein [Caballeronia glathei]